MLDAFPRIGELFALLTAICWTVTAMSFESAGKKVGSLPVNLMRLLIALVFFSVFGYLQRGLVLPLDASAYTWKWLSVSAVVGFCVGDLLLFKAFVVIGSRISMLIMSGVPPLTALLGWLFLNERLSWVGWLGMLITIGGICLVIGSKRSGEKQNGHVGGRDWGVGLLYAIGGGVGQSFGLILSKMGMQDYNAFAATHIRVIVGAVGFAIIFTVSRRWNGVFSALRNRSAMKGILLGSFFGPFLGVSFSLLSIQHTQTGTASTIMSIVPVLIIPPAVLVFKERVSFLEILGSILAVFGVAILFL